MKRSTTFTLLVAGVLAVAACSPAAAAPNWTYTPPQSGDAPASADTGSGSTLGTVDAPREIDVMMSNFAFEPASLDVKVGETIRFVITNPTTIPHEFVLGDAAEQEHHAMEMAGGMSDEHDMAAEPNELEVKPGETGELVWTFDEAGEQLMGCHVAGHWESGMVGQINVGS